MFLAGHMYKLRMRISNLTEPVGFVAFFDYAHLFLGASEWIDQLCGPFTPHLIIVTNPWILLNVDSFTIAQQ